MAARGCFDEVQRRLGARFVLTQSRIAATASPGGRLAVEIDLDNRGFASLYNRRDVEIVLENEESGAVQAFVVNVDPRTWKPGASTCFRRGSAIPAMALGEYTAYLHLPDPSPPACWRSTLRISARQRGVWDEERGYNELARGIVIRATE